MSTVKVWLGGDQVRVGDKLLLYQWSHKMQPTPISVGSKGGLVTQVKTWSHNDDSYQGHDGQFYVGKNRTLLWFVERDEFYAEDIKPSAPAPTKKVVDEWPHTCTRCGMAAYVGLFEVTHKNEVAAKNCPAWRP